MEAQPSEAARNQPIKLIVTINAESEDYYLGDMDEFNILSHPRSGVMKTEVSGMANDITEKITVTYNNLIVPKYPGKYKLLPATFVVDGKKVETNDVTIKVSDSKVS